MNGKGVPRVNPDGSSAIPALQFWDSVKRNLDDTSAVDTLGLNLEAVVHPADTQDRKGGSAPEAMMCSGPMVRRVGISGRAPNSLLSILGRRPLLAAHVVQS